MLFLILHAFKHFIYSGFGVRMVLDVLLYMKTNGNQCDWAYIQKCLEQVHAWRFFSDLVRLGNQRLGFHLEEPGSVTCPDKLLKDMMESGLFGNIGEERTVAAVLTTSAMSHSLKKKQAAGGRTLWKLLFPGKEWLYAVNPEVKNKPWLAVLLYGDRIRKLAGYVWRRKKRGSSKGMELAKKRMELLRKYGIL